MITEAKQNEAIEGIRRHPRLLNLFAPRFHQHLAEDLVEWTTEIYNAGTMDPAILEKRVKQRVKQEYGSVLVMILFSVAWSVIWEIIKRKLLD